MTLQQNLIELEKQFWTGNPAFYRAHLDEKCLIAFTEMAGVMSRDEIAGNAPEQPRWRDVGVEPVGLVEVDDKTAIFSYRARATRVEGNELRRALCSSVYVKRGSEW